MSASDLSAITTKALARSGADTVFGMPGGGNNLDFIGAAEAEGMRFVLAHTETSAVIMATVYGDLTQTPGVCVVTRGPGAASAVNGAANALLDRQAVILVTDAVSEAERERIAHQRIDQRSMFAPVTKWTATIGQNAAETAEHAVSVARSVPRGPVHLDFDPTAPSTPVPGPPQLDQSVGVERARSLMAAARFPVVLLGIGARDVVTQVRDLVADTSVPVLSTYRAKGIVPDSWPNNAGLLTGATTEAPLLDSADLIVMIGVDSVEFIPNAWDYPAPVISLTSWPETSPYISSVVEVVGDLELALQTMGLPWADVQWTEASGSTHRDSELARLLTVGPDAVGVSPQRVVVLAREEAPQGSIATVDAGAHMLPATSLWATEDVDELLISSGLATMGYSVPAAIAAALAKPDRRVVCFVGDGGLGMSLGDLETMRRLNLNITVVVFNDARLSLIAIKAKPEGNGGDNAIGYERTDFAAVARGYGLAAHNAADEGALRQALSKAMVGSGPTLVDVDVDPRGYPEILAAVRGRR